jgi:hypothetical protein
MLLVFFNGLISAQTVATFEVTLPHAATGIVIPVSVNLDQITFLPGSSLALMEVSGNERKQIPFQIYQGQDRMLYWQIVPGSKKQAKYTYQLVRDSKQHFDKITAANNNGSITFEADNKNLLRYQYETVYPPEGQDSSYKRSGFIHPLWTPDGQVLTRIQPPDHYHHYGIWNPWTHVLFEGDTVDFWNIRGKQGTVRFAKFISTVDGDVFAEIEALHEHIVFSKDGSEKKALNELQTIRVYKPKKDGDYFIVDVTSKLNCATENPFHILAYRYAGFGWRATAYWDKDNMEVLTSEGKTRLNTDNTHARWIISQGALPDNSYGGLLMMSYPANYNHPEPLRIWDLNANRGRGDYFANFAPTKDVDWVLEPGKTYVLKYRLIAFSGKYVGERAESAWQDFAKPPEVFIIKGN